MDLQPVYLALVNAVKAELEAKYNDLCLTEDPREFGEHYDYYFEAENGVLFICYNDLDERSSLDDFFLEGLLNKLEDLNNYLND